MDRKQVASMLLRGSTFHPRFDSVLYISMSRRRFSFDHLLITYLMVSSTTFSPSLTTTSLKRSSMEWFEACPCRPAPGGLISHLQYSCAGSFMPASRHTKCYIEMGNVEITTQ